MIAFNKGCETTTAATGSVIIAIAPVITALLGFALAGELPDSPTIAGGIIILTGMAIFNFGDRLYERYSQQKSERKLKCIE